MKSGMNFFINRAIGIGNSGVEHAQFYRAMLFDKGKIPYKYIFTGLIKELSEAMEYWNIPSDKVINIWEYFVLGETVLKTGVIRKNNRSNKIVQDSTNTHRIVETVTGSGMTIKEHIEKSINPRNPKTLLVSRYKIEIFDSETGERKIMFNEYDYPRRGRVLENIHVFNFNGEDLFFKNEILFQRYFFELLSTHFSGKNNFILDRGEESEVALFNNKFLNCNLIEIIHADHLSDRDVKNTPLWNNYYEYLLTHVDAVDRIIVATELQKEDILLDFPQLKEKIVAIPVGGIRDRNKETRKNKVVKKQPTRFMTASRLASEKHIDLAIKSFVSLHKEYPSIIFDIYGQGSERGKLQKLIDELEANDYIKLKGHSRDISKIYEDYDVFLSASYSEGFGLTYIEALNAGLPVVTFKARFGAMELIKSGKNGYLKEFSRESEDVSIKNLTKGIHQILNRDYSKFTKSTISSVKKFQDNNILEKWREMLNGL